MRRKGESWENDKVFSRKKDVSKYLGRRRIISSSCVGGIYKGGPIIWLCHATGNTNGRLLVWLTR